MENESRLITEDAAGSSAALSNGRMVVYVTHPAQKSLVQYLPNNEFSAIQTVSGTGSRRITAVLLQGNKMNYQ